MFVWIAIIHCVNTEGEFVGWSYSCESCDCSCLPNQPLYNGEEQWVLQNIKQLKKEISEMKKTFDKELTSLKEPIDKIFKKNKQLLN